MLQRLSVDAYGIEIREGLLDAMRKRHTYGATDNIILDVRMDRVPAISLFEKFGFKLSRSRDINDRRMLDFYMDLYSEPGT